MALELTANNSLSDSEEKEWNNFLLGNKYSHIYQTAEMARIFEKTMNAKPRFISGKEGGKTKAQILFLESKFGLPIKGSASYWLSVSRRFII